MNTGNLEGLNDGELLNAAKKGNMYAYEEFIGRHQGCLFNFIHNMVNDRFLAEDVVQESFVKLYYSLGKLRHTVSIRSYLFTIARNLLIDKIRKKRVSEATLDSVAEQMTLAAPSAADNEGTDIHSFLSALSDDEKAAVLLFFRYDFSYQEIAETLGIPLGTVKSRIHNSVKKLRGRINEKLQ